MKLPNTPPVSEEEAGIQHGYHRFITPALTTLTATGMIVMLCWVSVSKGGVSDSAIDPNTQNSETIQRIEDAISSKGMAVNNAEKVGPKEAYGKEKRDRSAEIGANANIDRMTQEIRDIADSNALDKEHARQEAIEKLGPRQEALEPAPASAPAPTVITEPEPTAEQEQESLFVEKPAPKPAPVSSKESFMERLSHISLGALGHAGVAGMVAEAGSHVSKHMGSADDRVLDMATRTTAPVYMVRQVADMIATEPGFEDQQSRESAGSAADDAHYKVTVTITRED